MLFYTGISGGVASCQQPKKTFLYPKRTHFYIIPSPAFGVVLEYDRASEEDADAYQCWVHLKYLKIKHLITTIYISYKYVEFRNILALC